MPIGIGEDRVEQADKAAERLVLAGVRGCGNQDQVPALVLGDAGQQVVAKLGGPSPVGVSGDAGVCLGDDHQVGAVLEEVVAGVSAT